MPSINLSVVARTTVLVLVTTLMVACVREQPEQLLASARDYAAKGDRASAVIQLRNLLKSSPENGEARLMLGQLLLEADDYVSAEKELGRALELRQPQEKVLPDYTRALLAVGKYQEVVRLTDKYRLFSPAAVAATQTTLAEALVNLGDAGRAREAYAAAVAAMPGHPRARFGLLTMTVAEKQPEEALKEVDEIIAASPKLSEARVFRARILLAMGNRDGAIKELEQTIVVSERFTPARVELIRLLTDERRFEDAAKLIESSQKLAPGDLRITFLDATLAMRRGDMERARQQVQQVLKHSPDHVPSLELAGYIALKTKHLSEAEAHLRRAVTQAPQRSRARQLLVQTYLRLGQPAKAKEALQPLIERGTPEDSRLLMLAGETYLANGDVRQATAFYQAAAKSKSGSQASAHARLGSIALAGGRIDEGLREFETAAELDEVDYQADLALITVHLRRGEVDRATEAAKALEKKQPNNPLTFQMFAAISMARRDTDGARRYLEKALEIRPTYLPAAYALAQLDLGANKPDVARKRYEAMIAKDPGNDQLYAALAELLMRSGGSAAEVGATLRRGVAANPQAPGARLALINYLLRTGQAKAANAAAQEAVAALPTDARVLDAAGRAQEAAGEFNQAVETLRKQLAQRPDDLRLSFRLAAVYVRLGRTDDAIEVLRRAQKTSPRQAEIMPKIVLAFLAAGRYEDASREARALQKREPKSAVGWSLEGDVLAAQKKFDEAERMYREALRLQPASTDDAIKLHATLLAGGKSAQADAFGREWITQNPKGAAMRVYLGDREMAAGNFKPAAVQYQAALVADPNNVDALNSLAWVAGRVGDPKALSYAERAVALAPGNVAVLNTYAMLLLSKGETDKALTQLEKALALAPERGDLRLNYAKALARAGRKAEARAEFEGLLKMPDGFTGKDEVANLLKAL